MSPAAAACAIGTLQTLPWRRRGALALLVLAVAALHAWALLGWPNGRVDGAVRGGVRALQVRQIAPQPAAGAVGLAAAGAPAAPGAAPPARRAPAPPASAAAVVPPVPAPPAPPQEPSALAPPAGGVAPPRYATALPPAAALGYELRRGAGVGDGELEWRLEGDRYELALRGGRGSAEALGWTSRGRVDADGVAPERFVVRRRGRDALAVNFERDDAGGGRIRFSGPTLQLPLLPGAQDRVSWMLQLAAIVQADPTLGTEGARVSMWVVGPRGEADVWTFTVQGRGGVDLPERRVEDALHWVREPERPYDTRVQVWLDPSRHYLPVRLLLQAPPGRESTEFLLRTLRLE
ncbi:MAG: DUF3108 domain-containing protein [Comamonadaceae bacterium]|nr:DUF3108 domain-containing protein [Rubrivivax sp.]NLZ42383.1 DUF3108 domain-containing protein [Comamonadaceae bacterium]